MSDLDIYIRDTISKFSIIITLALLIFLILIEKRFKEVRQFFFKKHLKKFNREYGVQTEGVKAALFHDLDDIVSQSIELRNRGLIRLLEIGPGSGSNLKYYPQQCRLVVADPDIYFKRYFLESKNTFPDIFLEKYLVTEAEDLSGVPSNTVDVVVTTFVLCSVKNVSQTISEIYRVLAPKGRYYYLEHICDYQGTSRRKRQEFLSNYHIWPAIFGCWLNRPIDRLIAEGKFKEVAQKRIDIKSEKISRKFFNLIKPHIVGVAVK